jgi:hypothetical protein
LENGRNRKKVYGGNCMKKGWEKIGKVDRPKNSLVFVDGSGNVMSKGIKKSGKKKGGRK